MACSVACTFLIGSFLRPSRSHSSRNLSTASFGGMLPTFILLQRCSSLNATGRPSFWACATSSWPLVLARGCMPSATISSNFFSASLSSPLLHALRIRLSYESAASEVATEEPLDDSLSSSETLSQMLAVKPSIWAAFCCFDESDAHSVSKAAPSPPSQVSAFQPRILQHFFSSDDSSFQYLSFGRSPASEFDSTLDMSDASESDICDPPPPSKSSSLSSPSDDRSSTSTATPLLASFMALTRFWMSASIVKPLSCMAVSEACTVLTSALSARCKMHCRRKKSTPGFIAAISPASSVAACSSSRLAWASLAGATARTSLDMVVPDGLRPAFIICLSAFSPSDASEISQETWISAAKLPAFGAPNLSLISSKMASALVRFLVPASLAFRLGSVTSSFFSSWPSALMNFLAWPFFISASSISSSISSSSSSSRISKL
eukprot:SAG22_NODE_2390_length_2625_cov_1.651623_3_plen_434_part_01